MDVINVLDFIQKTYLILSAVCFVIGYAIKNTALIKDKYIPAILVVVGGGLGAIMSTQTDLSLFDSIMQGLLCGGFAVGVHQIPKQLRKE